MKILTSVLDELDVESGEELIKVDPVDKRKSDGDTYKYRYSFNRVHLDNLTDDDFKSQDAEVEVYDDHLVWSYPGKPAVLITEDGCFGSPVNGRNVLQKQAYFALSILDSMGNVSSWKKVS